MLGSIDKYKLVLPDDTLFGIKAVSMNYSVCLQFYRMLSYYMNVLYFKFLYFFLSPSLFLSLSLSSFALLHSLSFYKQKFAWRYFWRIHECITRTLLHFFLSNYVNFHHSVRILKSRTRLFCIFNARARHAVSMDNARKMSKYTGAYRRFSPWGNNFWNSSFCYSCTEFFLCMPLNIFEIWFQMSLVK